jgi:hypothetical protein
MSTTLEPQVMPPTELALEVPKEMTALVANASNYEIAASEFLVDSEASFQVADQIQASLKAEAKKINDQRMELTRPIDTFKKKIVEFFSPAVDGRTKAATIYQQKMLAFRRHEREKAEQAQREAERLLQIEREKKEAEARKLEAKAATLKTDSARQKALQDAEDLRQTAALMPETVALSAPEPQTVASNVAQTWKAEVKDTGQFLRWLILHPEWHTCVKFQEAEMNRLARQVRDAVPVQGVRIYPQETFRTKSR